MKIRSHLVYISIVLLTLILFYPDAPYNYVNENQTTMITIRPQKLIIKLDVTATAYNNVPDQTDDTPNIAAFGPVQDRMIAVSRSLIFLKNKMVTVEGMGEFKVLDLMNKRFKDHRIDIFMWKDIKKAKEFGKKKVTISWEG